MIDIVKTFTGIVACDNISIAFKPGEVHALLGENGAGKSTLMSVLFGMYRPESGIIKIKGKEVNITGRCSAGRTCPASAGTRRLATQ